MTHAHGTTTRPAALLGMGLLALTGCATPTTEIQPSTDDAVYTASGRFPAARGGILVAQSAALTEGRDICAKQGKRFRALASIAGEDPATGEAIYAVRFRCFVRPGAATPIIAPLPDRQPGTDQRM